MLSYPNGCCCLNLIAAKKKKAHLLLFAVEDAVISCCFLNKQSYLTRIIPGDPDKTASQARPYRQVDTPILGNT